MLCGGRDPPGALVSMEAMEAMEAMVVINGE